MKTILIVEDHELNLKLMQEVLRGQGYQTLSARSGEECMAFLETVVPDLILMDIHMPGISGIETLILLKKKLAFANTPVIAVTASVMPSDKLSTLEAGFDAFIDKPIDIETFLATVEKHLNLSN